MSFPVCSLCSCQSCLAVNLAVTPDTLGQVLGCDDTDGSVLRRWVTVLVSSEITNTQRHLNSSSYANAESIGIGCTADALFSHQANVSNRVKYNT